MGRKQGAARTARPGINGRGAGVWQKLKQLYLIFLLPFLYFVVFRYGAMGWLRLAFKDHNAVEGLWDSERGRLKSVIEFFHNDGLQEAAAQHAVGGASGHCSVVPGNASLDGQELDKMLRLDPAGVGLATLAAWAERIQCPRAQSII